MREIGLMFRDWSVRAILEGRKTQTRRLVKPQPEGHIGIGWYWQDGKPHSPDEFVLHDENGDPIAEKCPQPRLRVGDVMYVKEAWGVGSRPDPYQGWRDGVEYRADEMGLAHKDVLPLYSVTPPDGKCLDDYNTRSWRSPMFMPKWVARIRRPITRVRVERVQEISEEDAKAEGMKVCCPTIFTACTCGGKSARALYEEAWQEINGPDSWEKNPWVWVYEWENPR